MKGYIGSFMNEHDIKFVWVEEKSKRKAKAYFKNYAQANPNEI